MSFSSTDQSYLPEQDENYDPATALFTKVVAYFDHNPRADYHGCATELQISLNALSRLLNSKQGREFLKRGLVGTDKPYPRWALDSDGSKLPYVHWVARNKAPKLEPNYDELLPAPSELADPVLDGRIAATHRAHTEHLKKLRTAGKSELELAKHAIYAHQVLARLRDTAGQVLYERKTREHAEEMAQGYKFERDKGDTYVEHLFEQNKLLLEENRHIREQLEGGRTPTRNDDDRALTRLPRQRF